MFNTLYRCPRAVARHENAPLAESRRRYLEHLGAQGAAIHTIRAAAGVLYRATMMMKLDESSPVERRDVERAARHWAHRWYLNASSRGPDQTDKEFRQTTCLGFDDGLHHLLARAILHRDHNRFLVHVHSDIFNVTTHVSCLLGGKLIRANV